MKPNGNRIFAARKAAGYSQEEVGERLHVSRKTIGKWESGKTSPGTYDLERLCEMFNCDFGYLVGEYDEKTRQITDIEAETGLSAEAIEVLQALKYNGLSDVLDLISDAIIYSIQNPLYSESDTLLFQALSNTIHLYKLGVLGEMEEKGYLWLLQDMFMEFIKHRLMENKNAPALIAPRQKEKEMGV